MTQSVNSAEPTTIEDQKCPEMHYEPIDKVNSRPLRSFGVVWETYMLEYTWLHFRSHSFLECDSIGIQPQKARIKGD